MPVDRELIFKKLDFLNKHIASIENMEFGLEEFVNDEDIHDLVAFRLQQAVETCIDISTHIISTMNLSRKETAKDAFLVLGERKIIESELALKMGKAADFRNRVVHGYNDFDYSLLFEDYQENLNDLREFGKQLLEAVNSSEN
jgi:uncharacterized protein YutE (UPF0331/DUF86 family)